MSPAEYSKDISWPEQRRKQLLPTRGGPFVGQWRPDDTASLWRELRTVLKVSQAAIKEGLQRASADHREVQEALLRFIESDTAPAKLDLNAQAAAFELIGARQQWRSAEHLERFIRYWIATAGAAASLGTLATAMTCRWEGSKGLASLWLTAASAESVHPLALGMLAWPTLRQYYAVASDEEYARGKAVAAELRATASLSASTCLSLIFPCESDWAATDLKAWTDRPSGGYLQQLRPMAWSLLSATTDAAAVLAILEADPPGISNWGTTSPYAFADEMVARMGAAAAEPLILLIELAEYASAEVIRKVAWALALICSERVARFFAGGLGSKVLRPIATEYFRSSPQLAVPILAEAAAGSETHAEVAKALLASLICSVELADDAFPSLSPKARAVLESLRGRAQVAREATDDELPPVLVDPPWTRRTKQAPPTVISDVQMLAREEVLAFRPGDTERWLAGAFQPEPEKEAEILGAIEEAIANPDRIVYGWELLRLPGPVALKVLDTVPLTVFDWYGEVAGPLLVRCGLTSIPALIRYAAFDPSGGVEALASVDSTRVAPVMADAFIRLKKSRPLAQEWLLRFPETAAVGLIPSAVGPLGKTRSTAEAVLRFLASRGHAELVRSVADRYGAEVRAAVEAILAYDPLQAFPSRLPKLPGFWNASAFTRPLLKGRQAALPLKTVEALATMLAFSPTEPPYAGLALVKEACDLDSLASFAWDLFQAWLTEGAPSKEQWAFHALGHLGSDETARKLTPLIRGWPTEGASARAYLGLDVLALLGTDAALMQLHGIAQKVKSRPLQEKARTRMEQVAQARGLTAEELVDRLVPQLGLDDDGSLTLDFGPRRFQVSFDESLKPVVVDSSGKRLPELPKPNKGDDEEKAKASHATWKALKKEVRGIATAQLKRLEQAMCSERRWSADVFRSILVDHPLLIHLVRRIVWGVFDEDGQLQGTFRVAEDRSFADEQDSAFTLPPEATVGIPHRLVLSDAVATAWGQVFADYQTIQPFTQLSRPVFTATNEERSGQVLTRAQGMKVPTVKLLSLDTHGWRRGPAYDGGVAGWYEKPLGNGTTLRLALEPGIYLGAIADSAPQTLGEVVIQAEGTWGEPGQSRFSMLSPIAMSELIADLERLRP